MEHDRPDEDAALKPAAPAFQAFRVQVPGAPLYFIPPHFIPPPFVAQSAEQRPDKPQVAGANPAGRTTFQKAV